MLGNVAVLKTPTAQPILYDSKPALHTYKALWLEYTKGASQTAKRTTTYAASNKRTDRETLGPSKIVAKYSAPSVMGNASV